MNLSQRLTQLRKQVGRNVVLHVKNNQALPLSDRLKHTNIRVNPTACVKKIPDEQLAEELKGEVLSAGLIYLRSEQPLNAIHDTYNANTLHDGIQTWSCDVVKGSEDLLFIDTETTGLSGGVGTLVFLLGVAEICGNTIINHQLLLNGMQGEKAMLTWFNKKLTGKKTLVSYNGKSFDIPLLVNRFRLQKLPSSLLAMEHIDLLHWIRRMYQKYWSDCRLPSAEQHCLKFFRHNDISGADAPQIWHELIRQSDITRLVPLLKHHYWDVLSLVGLLDYVIKRINPLFPPKKLNYFSVANYLVKHKEVSQALRLLEIHKAQLCPKGLMLLADICKKNGNYEAALTIWLSLAKLNHILAIEFIAKYYEHVTKQNEIALRYATLLVSISGDNVHKKRQNRLKLRINRETLTKTGEV